MASDAKLLKESYFRSVGSNAQNENLGNGPPSRSITVKTSYSYAPNCLYTRNKLKEHLLVRQPFSMNLYMKFLLLQAFNAHIRRP